MLKAFSTSVISPRRILPREESPQVKIKMPPKRKILGDLPTNNTCSVNSSTPTTEGVNPLKRQRRQPQKESAISLSPEVKRAASQQIASSSLLQEKKPGIKRRAQAESLPPPPQFQPFDSSYPEHNSEVEI